MGSPVPRRRGGVGFGLATRLGSAPQNTELASGIFFFFTMELLQFFQYFWIAADLGSPGEHPGGGG